jgi:hypothetical protein
MRTALAKRCHKPGSMLSNLAAACGCEDLFDNDTIELRSVEADTPGMGKYALCPCGSAKK